MKKIEQQKKQWTHDEVNTTDELIIPTHDKGPEQVRYLVSGD